MRCYFCDHPGLAAHPSASSPASSCSTPGHELPGQSEANARPEDTPSPCKRWCPLDTVSSRSRHCDGKRSYFSQQAPDLRTPAAFVVVNRVVLPKRSHVQVTRLRHGATQHHAATQLLLCSSWARLIFHRVGLVHRLLRNLCAAIQQEYRIDYLAPRAEPVVESTKKPTLTNPLWQAIAFTSLLQAGLSCYEPL